MTRTCKKCLQEKDIDQFYFRKDTKTYTHECKECCRKRFSEYGKNNREVVYKRQRKHRQNNLEKYAAYYKQYRKDHKDIINDNQRKRNENNREHLQQLSKKYYRAHREERIKWGIEYRKNRKKTDARFYALDILRGQFKKWLVSNDYGKNSHVRQLIGCSLDDFLIYLGEIIPNANYDHILPLAKFNNVSQEIVEKLLWNYRNFQYLDKELNQHVKADKLPIDWKERLTNIGNALSIDVSEIIKTVESEILPHELFWDNDKKELRQLETFIEKNA